MTTRIQQTLIYRCKDYNYCDECSVYREWGPCAIDDDDCMWERKREEYTDIEFLISDTEKAYYNCYKNAMVNLSETAKKFSVSEEALKRAYSITTMGQTRDTIEIAKELDKNYTKFGEYKLDKH